MRECTFQPKINPLPKMIVTRKEIREMMVLESPVQLEVSHKLFSPTGSVESMPTGRTSGGRRATRSSTSSFCPRFKFEVYNGCRREDGNSCQR